LFISRKHDQPHLSLCLIFQRSLSTLILHGYILFHEDNLNRLANMKPPDLYARFPNDPCFSQLLAVAEQKRSSIIVNDPGSGVKADYNRLLRDVSSVRQSLCESLPSSYVRGGSILSEDPVYVCTLLGPNYTFIVALLAILATGGAAVPLCKTSMR
jgi:malonyl-CoA/methylmalonyl-CoA synthetase